jgi:hypothetical protein
MKMAMPGLNSEHVASLMLHKCGSQDPDDNEPERFKILRNIKYTLDDDFAACVGSFVGLVEEILELGPHAVEIAFDPVLYLGRRVHGDLRRKGESGNGDSQTHYSALDEIMLRMIEIRDADRTERGYTSLAGWTKNSSSELVEQRDHTEEHGLKGFVPRSKAKLQDITSSAFDKPVDDQTPEQPTAYW